MRRKQDGTILRATGLKVYFPVRRGLLGRTRYVRAVDGVDLAVRRGRTLGLVGESGSGKTTLGRAILRLVPASEGDVIFNGRSVLSLTPRQMRALRRRMQIIFQDPFSSLNPRMTVESIVGDPLVVHRTVPRRRRPRRVGELLERVGLAPSDAKRYPHEFSGGQRQRIGIARALASNPDFIVCDEPVSALDVSIQAQILNLLRDLQDELGLSYLFIAHNLAVVEHFADDVAVMYLGRIVETAGRDELYNRPTHPYTQSLLSAVPKPVPPGDSAQAPTAKPLPGEPPSPIDPPRGCPFHPRCPLTREAARALPPAQTATILSNGQSINVSARCVLQTPTLRPTKDAPAHLHACLLRHV